jgi:HSP20 family protein
MSKQATPPPEEQTAALNQHCFTPRADIWETQDALYLELEMPGVSPDDVDVRLDNQVLNVLGRVPPHEYGERLHAEYATGNFERAFRISEQIDVDGIRALMQDGVLTLTLPKTQAATPKRIAVNAA